MNYRLLFIVCCCFFHSFLWGQTPDVQLHTVQDGWAANSVNTVIFRKNALVTHKDTQFIAFYDKDAFVVVGKRKLNSAKWILQKTAFTGKTTDAHNSISIMADGSGYLHLSWNHHGDVLNYTRSIAPGSLQFEPKFFMAGLNEAAVTYPEFYLLPNGNLIFLYRDGASGRGNLVVNQYNHQLQRWQQLHNNLIDGNRQRNAYWQACTDENGSIHLSWVWRESADVASNHDICYARSDDGGVTWKKSDGSSYNLPINKENAEYAWRVPEGSELINQTSMFASASNGVYIATYWKPKNAAAPQYQVVYLQKGKWQCSNLNTRTTNFSLSGTGTKKIPVSRPQIIGWKQKGKMRLALIFRDAERGNAVSVAVTNAINSNQWQVKDLLQADVGQWEPTYDSELWKQKKLLHLFVQKVVQADGEGITSTPPQPVQVLEWKPKK